MKVWTYLAADSKSSVSRAFLTPEELGHSPDVREAPNALQRLHRPKIHRRRGRRQKLKWERVAGKKVGLLFVHREMEKKIKMRLLFLLQRKKTEIGEEEEDERVAGERKKILRRTCGGVRERKK
jgi:hypothetical protein